MYIIALHTAKMWVSAHKKAEKGEKCRIVYIFALHTAKMIQKLLSCGFQLKNAFTM